MTTGLVEKATTINSSSCDYKRLLAKQHYLAVIFTKSNAVLNPAVSGSQSCLFVTSLYHIFA